MGGNMVVFAAASASWVSVLLIVAGVVVGMELLALTLIAPWYWRMTRLPVYVGSPSLTRAEFSARMATLRHRLTRAVLLSGLALGVLAAMISVTIYPSTHLRVMNYLLATIGGWLFCVVVMVGAPALFFYRRERVALLHLLARQGP